MQTQPQPVPPPQPRVFNYSLDWRFLLPVADPDKVFVLFEEDTDFAQTLAQAGISSANQLSFADLKAEPRRRVQSLVLPFGLPVRWVGAGAADQTELYRSLRRLVEPGGHFVVGFNNAWYGRRAGSIYHGATPERMASRLNGAGFRSIEILGAMPDLSIPEYILQLQPQAILFALRHRFRRKPIVLKLLRVLSKAPGRASMSSLLPCYFAVAVT